MRDHLVVVVPGIGGSVLVDAADESRVVWSAGLSSIGDILRRPERLSIGEHDELTPRGLVRSLKPFGIWTAIPGYEGLLDRLAVLPEARLDRGEAPVPDLDANMAAFGYDFRLGVQPAADRLDTFIRERLARLWPDDPTGKARVLIIAHSMGGLVARLWAGQPDNWPLCRAIMTLATPHRGAPKALDILANGVAVKGIHLIQRPRPVLSEWQGVYDLLPRFACVADQTTGSTVSEWPLLRPHELPTDWLPATWSVSRTTTAHDLHQEIQVLWEVMPQRGPELVPRIGYGHGTLRRGVWDGKRIKVSTDPFLGHDLGGWAADEGDGTVPADSGLPVEQSDRVPVGLRQQLRHGPIGGLPEAVAWVESFEGRSTITTEGDTYPTVLGMSVDPVVEAGDVVEVTARVAGIDTSPADALVFLTLNAADGPPRSPRQLERMEWDSATGCFRGSVRPATAGLFAVKVMSDAIPHGGALSSSETIEAIDGDDVD